MSTQPYHDNEPEKLKGVSVNLMPLFSKRLWFKIRLWWARKKARWQVPDDIRNGQK